MERPIDYWRDYYLLHSKSDNFRRKVEKSLNIINEFIAIGSKNYVSFSGGKDSSVMVRLVSIVDDTIRVMSEKDDFDFPNEKEFVVEFCERCNVELDIIEPENILKLSEKVDFTEDIHSQNTDFSKNAFYGLIKSYQLEGGYKGAFLGLRSEESKQRSWNAKVNRYIYYNLSWQQLICQPIVEWNGKDVFAYLFKNELPILDVYFKTAFVESPEQIRKSWVLPSAQSCRGQAVWLKKYYPQIYNKLCLINPKIRCYV